MLTPRKRVIAGIILLVGWSCNHQDQQALNHARVLVDFGTGKGPQTVSVSEKKILRKKIGPQKNFLDSVLIKMDLSFGQVNQHTDLESFYFKENVRFSGDTVW